MVVVVVVAVENFESEVEIPKVGASVTAFPSPSQHVKLLSPQHHLSLVGLPSHGVMRMLSFMSVMNSCY